MRAKILLPILLVFFSTAVFAEEIGKFDTAMSFQTGTIIVPEESRTEAYVTMGFETSRGPFFMWTGMGGTVKVMPDKASAFLYPWMISVAGMPAFSSRSGVFSVRPQVTLPWSTLTYKSPGIGLIASADGSGKSPTSLSAQLEIDYFPPLLVNPWYATAKSAGSDVGEKFWQIVYGGYLKAKLPNSLVFGIDARIETDNTAYYVDKTWMMIPTTNIAAFVELPGISFRAGFTLNGWNVKSNGGNLEYAILPNISILLGRVPFYM